MPATAPSRSRALRIALRAAGLLLGVPLALILVVLAVVLIGANTDPGRRLIEREAGSLTSGLVGIQGLGGRFPDALTIDRLTLHDTRGPWLAIDHLVLDWSPLRLLTRTARVELARAERIEVPRLPAPDPNARPAPPKTNRGRSGSAAPIDAASSRAYRSA